MNTGRLSVLTACMFLTIIARAQTPGVYLGDLSWPEAEYRFSDSPIVIVPFGAGAKEHGPHLPMNADRVVMDYLLAAAVESKNVIVAPPVLHGWFHGAQRIVFLNTGISKATGLPISIAAREIRVQTGVPTLVVSWDDLETDEVSALQDQVVGGHGDEIETSINLYLQPENVQMDLAVRDYGERTPKDYGGYQPGRLTRDENDPLYSASGIFGDATLATAVKGEKALAVLTREWLKALEGFAKVPLQRRD